MNRRDAYLDALTRELGAAYYRALRIDGSPTEVADAVEAMDAHYAQSAEMGAIRDEQPGPARWPGRRRSGRWRVRDRRRTEDLTGGHHRLAGPGGCRGAVDALPSSASLPVVDDGRLVGVVSRRDLLRTFLRPDPEIADEVHDLITSMLLVDSAAVSVQAHHGVVTISCQVGNPQTREAATRLAASVDGVVSVHARAPQPT